jgi:predicted O-methyltransferase YrrM
LGKISFLFKYIYFYFTSGNEHGLHSPFVFNLYSKGIRPKKSFYIFHKIESLRKELLRSKEIIEVKDLGAGSKTGNTESHRSIKGIASNSLKQAHQAEVLFKIIHYLKPKTILDLGTSLGITTLYQASADPESKVYTFEGSPEIAKVALQNFQKLEATNIRLIQGNIDETLPDTLNKLSSIDYVFFDANHRQEPTLRYFDTCLEKAHNDTVFIFDDIHWSAEMEQAWEKIKAHEKVTLTIDMFFIGLVFIRTNQPKQHFKLRI